MTAMRVGKAASNRIPGREANSIFLPAKEVLSLFHSIKKSRDTDQVFGFDDTCLDLVRAVEIDPGEMIDGKVIFDGGEWVFKKGNAKFSIHAASEGIKKISLLDTLLGNPYSSPESTAFIDEPEAALHPEALSLFMEIIDSLSETGIQFFIATHSYYVVKKLCLIARKKRRSLPTLCLISAGSVGYENTRDGIPANPIIGESVKLYREEVELSLQ